ncbi:MAG: hypothetical protein WBV39_14780 [Rudaea sp.]
MHRCIYFVALVTVLATSVAQAAASPQETVYRSYEVAMSKGDIDAMEATMTKARAAELQAQRDSPQFQMMFGFIRGNALHDTKVEKVDTHGNDATLSVSGKDSAGNPSTSSVHMLKEGGHWRIEKESTSTHAH